MSVLFFLFWKSDISIGFFLSRYNSFMPKSVKTYITCSANLKIYNFIEKNYYVVL